ncbi:hypothetical protein [uncultured Microbacterium sp.]|uniref:hypothetical protein n=1 Tax=uncultured Microbacterium sp. TaxID=191216 RepID=UPI0025D995BA|nr:hypothetical protein [uncultured Microbacterium sp.]
MPDAGTHVVDPATRVRAYTADAVRAAERPLLAEGQPLMAWAAAALADVVAAEALA